MSVGRPGAASDRGTATVDTLLEVRDDEGEPVVVAFMDGQARTWAFSPEDGMFHRDDAMFRDYYSDDPRFEYVPLGPPRAEDLMRRGLGGSPDADLFREARQQAAMSVSSVMARAAGRPGGGDDR